MFHGCNKPNKNIVNKPQAVPLTMLNIAKTIAWGIHCFLNAAVTAGAVEIPHRLAMLAIGTHAIWIRG